MKFEPVQVAAPESLPLSVAEGKVQCRVDSGDFDDEITALIEAAVSHLDGYSGVLGKCLMPQTWAQQFDCWQDFPLCLGPVISITSISYFNDNGDEQTVSDAAFRLERRTVGVFAALKPGASWPSANLSEGPITVTWQAGFADADAVPPSIKQAIKLLIAHWFENREAVIVGSINSKLQMAVENLIEPHRRVVL